MAAVNSQVKKVLVVCTGNTCRSPMAAGWLNRKLAGKGWVAESAGVSAWEGAPASSEAIEAMQEIGIDLASHRSRRLSPGMLEEAAIVLAMTDGHRRDIVHRHPAAAKKTFLVHGFGLGEVRDVPDPIGLPVDVYRHIRDEMIQALGDFLLYLAEHGQLQRN